MGPILTCEVKPSDAVGHWHDVETNPLEVALDQLLEVLLVINQ